MHEWGWLTAIDLFLSGLGAGTLIVASIVELTRKRYDFDFCPCTLVGAVVSGPLLAVSTFLLIFDLGAGLREPWRIPYLYTHASSVMTFGTWFRTLCIPAAFIYGFLELADTYPRLWSTVTDRLTFLTRFPVRPAKRVFAAVAGLLALVVATYTGFLISVVGPAVPFWSTAILPSVNIPVLPLLFLTSALSTGVGLTLDVASTLSIPDISHQVKQLPLMHLIVVGAETVLLGLLLISASLVGGAAAESARQIVIGTQSIVFWVLAVIPGFVFPLALHAGAAYWGGHSAFLGLVSGIGMLVGRLSLRYIIVVAGIHTFL